MLKRRGEFFLCLTLLMAGCSTGAGPSMPESDARMTRQQRENAAWAKLEQQPGSPGADFNPRRIIVTYGASSQVPQLWQLSGNPPNLAAQGPNAMLRKNKQYEALTDAIAQRFKLGIRQQVYRNAVNFASFDLPAGAQGNSILDQIRVEGQGAIAHAIFAPVSRAQYTPNDPDFTAGTGGAQWSHWLVRCEDAWDVTMGDPGVLVAVVDTGVMIAHEELSQQVIDPAVGFPSAHCDVVNNDNTVEDQVGHGTFIAGMVCAEGENSRTIVGVAPHCRVIPIKIANAPWASLDDLVAGAFLADELGAQVVNYSWGSSVEVPLEEAMINDLTAAGTLFVCAAGNDNTPYASYPAFFENALAVGATNGADNRAHFSNWGTYVDIAAPGQGLKSCSNASSTAYEMAGDGTSYAAPMVAAAAALLWSYEPNLTLNQVRSTLLSFGPEVEGFSNPMRRLDIADALGSLLNPIEPSIGGVSLQPRTAVGTQLGLSTLSASLLAPVDVKRVQYTLDLWPVGEASPNDWSTWITAGANFPVQFDISQMHNEIAALRVEYFSASGTKGAQTIEPVWIFNQRGDVDGDGLIGPLDSLIMPQQIGLDTNDPGYLPFADSDGDGRVTEADNAAIGYSYGYGVVIPNIISVTNTTLWLGTEQQIKSTVEGSGNLTFAWNFGGGATPNTSSLPSPTITAGSEGSYSASLTISSEYGTDYYPFTLLIKEKPPISIVLDIMPRVGLAPLNSYFDAHDSESVGGGDIVKYEWDWDGDDSTWEQESEFYAAYHTFPDLGTYTIHLRVTDESGDSAQTSAKVRVVEGLAYGSFGSRELGTIISGSNQPASLASAEISGRPAVCWMEKLPVESYNVAVAKVDTPLLSSDWRIDKVYTGTLDNQFQPSVGLCDIGGEAAFLMAIDGSLRYGRYYGDEFEIHTIPGEPRYGTLANIGGKPAVLAGQPDSPHYIYSTVADPDGPEDWIDVAITAPNCSLSPFSEYPWQLLEYAGVPVYQGSVGADRRVCWSTAIPPSSTSWESFIFEGVHTGAEQFGRLFDEGSTLGFLFELQPIDEKEVQYGRLALFPPSQLSDWTIHQARLPYKPVTVAGDIDGLPSFMTRDGELYLSLVDKPADAIDWLLVTTPNNFEGIRLVSHGGLPALFSVEPGVNKLKYLYPLL